MHPIDNPGDWLPFGLDPADVNGDGFDDYVTNYEYGGRICLTLHSRTALGDGAWPAVGVGRYPDAESAALGDLDGDGAVNVVVVHGIEHARQPPAVRILWGAGGSPSSWRDSGPLRASLGGWQFLSVRLFDLGSDGDSDIVADIRAARVAAEGQRGSAGAVTTWAGTRWPANRFAQGGDLRDLAAWPAYAIDPNTQSGHGSDSGDLDGDGDPDLVNATADWDTPEGAENVVWYENPGAESIAQPRPMHVVYRGSEFYGKGQATIVDLDGDGLSDIVVHVADAIYWFRNDCGPVQLTLEHIEKHPAAQWRARLPATAELNNDERLDIIGALIHRDGRLPNDRAALFWVGQNVTGWTTHVIKWGNGFRVWGLLTRKSGVS